MKTFLFSLYILIFSLTSNAKSVSCEIKLNNEKIFSNQVETKIKEKVFIGKTDTVTAYITERENNFYTIEAFLPEFDARLFAESHLRTVDDKISTTLWGRDSLIDLYCELMSVKK